MFLSCIFRLYLLLCCQSIQSLDLFYFVSSFMCLLAKFIFWFLYSCLFICFLVNLLLSFVHHFSILILALVTSLRVVHVSDVILGLIYLQCKHLAAKVTFFKFLEDWLLNHLVSRFFEELNILIGTPHDHLLFTILERLVSWFSDSFLQNDCALFLSFKSKSRFSFL